jgi:nitronate monooxygenase
MPDVESKRWRELWSAGQSVAQTEEIKPAGEIILEMVAGYKRACRKLVNSINDP